jgi:hypothetical protein
LLSDGKRKKHWESKHNLNVGDPVGNSKNGKVFHIIQKGVQKCVAKASVKIAPEDYVRNALLQEGYRKQAREASLSRLA